MVIGKKEEGYKEIFVIIIAWDQILLFFRDSRKAKSYCWDKKKLRVSNYKPIGVFQWCFLSIE